MKQAAVARFCRRSHRRGSRGFSLMEMLVALSMLTVVLIGALILLDTTNRVTRSQLARADVQQSVRIAQDELIRHVRTAGRGGLLADSTVVTLPRGIAVAVENNVTASRTLFSGNSNSPDVLEGSDILTVRGIFDTPLFYATHSDKSTFTLDVAAGTGEIQIRDTTPEGAFVQDLQVLEDMRTDAVEGEAMVMVSPFSDDVYGVAQIDWSASSYDSTNGVFTLAFEFEDDPLAIDPYNPSGAIAAVSALSTDGAYPASTLARSGFKTIGILQEYRYFIRDTDVSGDVGGRFAPKLSRTRTLINQDEYWDDDEEFEDIANHVIDLQVSFGFSDPATNAGELTETTDGVNDSWHLNNAADVALPVGDLTLMRVTTLARTAFPDRNFEARALLRLEDHSYTTSNINDPTERRHRRFFLETIVDLRNL